MGQNPIRNLIRSLVYATPLFRHFVPRYRNTYVPAHLCRLISLLDQTVDIPGSILEVGCFKGETTIWLNKHLEDKKIAKRYYALDTFEGFTDADLTYEVSRRGKRMSELSAFASNRRSWFDKTMRLNGLHNVTSIQADASKFDYSSVGPISFALVDLDLYLPMKAALGAAFAVLSPGGILVADDCQPNINYDGALQAFTEFVSDNHLPLQIDLNRLGVAVKG
jgi:SAM-dependent methyltransferase